MRNSLKQPQKQNVCTFRPTREMERLVTKVMEERGLDRTSVIKLALYMFTSYASRQEVRCIPLKELVARIESRAPYRFPSFATFAAPRRPALRTRSRREP